MSLSRRRFMILAASVASTTVLSTESRADAPLLAENDPTAQALGYKMDAAKVDKPSSPGIRLGRLAPIASCIRASPARRRALVQPTAASWFMQRDGVMLT